MPARMGPSDHRVGTFKGPQEAMIEARSSQMKPVRRWMKSVLVESAKPGVTLPWQRGARPTAIRRPKPQRAPGLPARS